VDESVGCGIQKREKLWIWEEERGTFSLLSYSFENSMRENEDKGMLSNVRMP